MLVILSLGLVGWFLFIKKFGVKLGDNKGGGSAPSIQQQPVTPAPSAGESASQISEAKLKYDPLTAASDWAIQQQYVPKQAELYNAIYNQYAPQMARQQQATQRELYPFQSQIVEQGAQQALLRLQNPDYMSPQEQQALDFQRLEQVTGLQRAMRERANLGGGLYGGRAAGAEAKSLSDLMQSFEVQDYQRRMGAGQAAQQALNPYMQILYPQVGTQQPNVGAYQYQSAVPGADTLYNAMFQASQPDTVVNPGSPSQAGGIAAGAGSAIGMIAMAI